MDFLSDLIAWVAEGISKFLPAVPSLPSLWRYLYGHIQNLPFIAAFVAMLYFAIGLAYRGARTSNARMYGILIFWVGLLGIIATALFVTLQSPAASPPPPANDEHAAEISRRLGATRKSAAPVENSGAVERIASHYVLFLPLGTMMVVGSIILLVTRRTVSR